MKKSQNLKTSQNSGVFQDFILRIRLILRLMGDRRVNLFLKLIPIASFIYLVSPIDLVPGLALPVIGALDDAAVIWIGTSLFVSLCPDDIVQEHINALKKVIPGTWREEKKPGSDGEIIDVEPRQSTENE